MLVRALIERVMNRGLYPAGENRPAFDILDADITSVANTMTVQGLEDYMPQSVIEFDDDSMEAAMTKEGETSTTIDLTTRGYLETTAAAHTSGTRVLIEPPFFRQDIFNEIQAVIGQLYGMGLYRLGYTEALEWNATDPTDLPASAVEVVSVRARSGADSWGPELRQGIDYIVLTSTTPKSIRFFYRPGTALAVTYRYDFTKPDALSDDLTTDCGIPDSLAPYLWLPVAGNLLIGKESSRVQIESVRQSLAAEGIQVGAVSSVAQAFISVFEQRHVAAERRKLLAQNPTRIKYEA